MERLTTALAGVRPPLFVVMNNPLILLHRVNITLCYLVYFSVRSTTTEICRNGRNEQFVTTHYDSLRQSFVVVNLYDNKIYILKKNSLRPLRRGVAPLPIWSVWLTVGFWPFLTPDLTVEAKASRVEGKTGSVMAKRAGVGARDTGYGEGELYR